MAQARDRHPEQPQVHPGGRLDEAPVSESGTAPVAPGEASVQGGGSEAVDATAAAQPDMETTTTDEEDDDGQASTRQLKRNQRRRRELLRECERLLLLDFDTLSMPDWPDYHQVGEARRRRDAWLAVMSVLATTVLCGMGNLVPALPAGVALGLLVLTVLWGVPAVRHVFTSSPSHAELLLKRRRMLHRARKHIEHLEGPLGLASSCRHLADYNPALRRSRFDSLCRLSTQGRLAAQIRSRAQAQFYLIYLLESEKAYNELTEAYFSTHELMLDEGEAQPLDASGEATDPEAVSLGNGSGE